MSIEIKEKKISFYFESLKKGLVIMMELMDRVLTLKEYNMMNEVAYHDILFIIKMMEEKYNIHLTEENAGVMITHITSAFRRNETGEEVEELSKSMFDEIRSLEEYPLAVEILDSMIVNIKNQVSQKERGYFLVHLCNLLAQI